MPDNQPDFFKSNLKLLRKNHPNIWEMMTKNPPEPEGEIILAPNGEPNLWTKDINGNRVSLHIPGNPGAEIHDIAKAVIEDFDGTLIITGMGLGFCPLAILEQRKSLRHLILFEPNAGIFLQALKAMDLSILFSDPRAILSIGEDQDIATAMAPANRALQLENIQHIKHNPSFALDFSKYNSLFDNINNVTNSLNMEGNTFLNMGDAFFTNRLKHLNTMHHNYLFDDLKGMFKDKPAIIVSAGPSLDQNIHLLKQIKNKAVIIAVDAALPSLVINNIMPDFVTAIDPSEKIYEKVADVTNQIHDISLICMSWVSSKMVKLFPADKLFWCFGAKPIEQWTANLVGCKALTTGASSVAHLNLIISIYMQCSPIIFVGQDLCFSQSKSHAAGTILSTNDMVNNILKNKKDIVWLDGIDGEKVPSDRIWQADKRHFERVIKAEKGHFINSTAQGCHIEGTIVMPLQEVIERFCHSEMNVKNIVAEKTTHKSSEILRKHLIKKLEAKIKTCKQIKKMLEETKFLLHGLLKAVTKVEKTKKLYQCFNDLSPSNQKKVLKLDKIGKKVDTIDNIWTLMQEVTMAGLRQSDQQKHVIDLLANDPKKYTLWLKKNYHRLSVINKARKKALSLFSNAIEQDISFLKSEEKLFTTLSKQKNLNDQNKVILNLLRLYFDAGNITLAQPWLKKIAETMLRSGEIYFFQGITAAHYTEYDKAETLFKKAVKIDPSYVDKIKEFRKHQGDAYISYIAASDTKDKAVAKRLLLKGLTYAPEHKKVKYALKTRCDQALKEIKNHEQEKTLSEAENTIDSWLNDLSSTKALTSIIGEETAAKLYQYKGIILADKEELEPAIEHFNKSLDIVPDNPALHIVLTNIYFAKQKYPKGIYHLKQAVSLDNVYAVYWEEIGDGLMGTEQYADALAAYENCFLILPGRVHLLKKIGDCYQKTGQLEAAREAYTNLNALLNES